MSKWRRGRLNEGTCNPAGPSVKPELPEAVPSGPSHQTPPAGLHHPHPALDICAVLQGRWSSWALMEVNELARVRQTLERTQNAKSIQLAVLLLVEPLSSWEAVITQITTHCNSDEQKNISEHLSGLFYNLRWACANRSLRFAFSANRSGTR